MELLGALWSRLQAYPEFNEMIEGASTMQRQGNKVVAGLQHAYGTKYTEFMRMSEGRTRDALMRIQEVGVDEIQTLKILNQATSATSTDLKQVNELHDRITKLRRQLQNTNNEYERLDRMMKDIQIELEKVNRSPTSSKGSTVTSKSLDKISLKRQEALKNLEMTRATNEVAERDYRTAFIQVSLAALEAFALAQYNSMDPLAHAGEQIYNSALSIEMEPDHSIKEYEEKLRLLEEEIIE